MSHNFDSIIFDLDGTLWDAVDLYAESWNLFFRKNKINIAVTKEFLTSLMGLEEEIYLSKVIPEYSKDKRKEIYQEIIHIQYDLIEKKGGLIYEGVIKGVWELSNYYKLFIVSNCPEHTIRYFIKACGIVSQITDYLSHGENFKSKQGNILEIKQRNNLLKPVYVGDTESDRIQCEQAGIPFIFMEYGFGTCNDYLFKFSSFDEFTKFMIP